MVAELDKVVLPYHLDTAKQLAGRLALDHVDEMNARVATLVEERGRLMARLVELPVQVWPSGANFILFRPTRVDGAQVWQDLLDRSDPGAQLRHRAPPRGLPAGHRGHPRRGRCLPRPP